MRDILTLAYAGNWLRRCIIRKNKRRRQALGADLERLGQWLKGESAHVERLEFSHRETKKELAKLLGDTKKLQASQQLYESVIQHARELFPEVFLSMEQRYGRLFAPYKALMALLEDLASKNATPDVADDSSRFRDLHVQELEAQVKRYGEVLAHAETLFPHVFAAMDSRFGGPLANKQALMTLLNALSNHKGRLAGRESTFEEIQVTSHDNPAYCRSVLTPRQDEA